MKFHWLLAIVPVTLAVHYALPEQQSLVFCMAALSMVPLPRLLSQSTEHLAARTGPAIGALLNVTFGNAGELFVGFFALKAGLLDLVQASLSGSILANLLLFLGVSMLTGGLRNKTLAFNSLAARSRATMLALAAIALILPAVYHYFVASRPAAHAAGAIHEADLSLEFAVILLLTYCLSLLFTLHTHRQLLAPPAHEHDDAGSAWSLRKGLTLLAVSSALIGWMSEVLAGSVEAATKTLGISEMFAGIIVVAIAGNAAEGAAAVSAALRNRMDLSVGISLGSSIQIALFVAPVLVIVSHFISPAPLNLLFTPVELIALVLAIAITSQISGDGESHWLEGVQLLAVYLMFGFMLYLTPA